MYAFVIYVVFLSALLGYLSFSGYSYFCADRPHWIYGNPIANMLAFLGVVVLLLHGVVLARNVFTSDGSDIGLAMIGVCGLGVLGVAAGPFLIVSAVNFVLAMRDILPIAETSRFALQRARRLMTCGQYEEALNLLEETEKGLPNDLAVKELLLRLYTVFEDHGEASRIMFDIFIRTDSDVLAYTMLQRMRVLDAWQAERMAPIFYKRFPDSELDPDSLDA